LKICRPIFENNLFASSDKIKSVSDSQVILMDVSQEEKQLRWLEAAKALQQKDNLLRRLS
jgi:esterase/lipase